MSTNDVTEPADLTTRQYADWWLWAQETLRGTTPRRRAAALAGMKAQASGASVESAIRSATEVFRIGLAVDVPGLDPAQRYAELYARAHLALGLDPDSAHSRASAALAASEPGADISMEIGRRTNTTAIVAAALFATGVLCLEAAVFADFVWDGPKGGGEAAFTASLLLVLGAFALGIASFVTGWFALAQIRRSGEAGHWVAMTSVSLGCLLALAACVVGFGVFATGLAYALSGGAP